MEVVLSHPNKTVATMRFSLRHLLLVFPAFLLGTFIAMLCQAGDRITYRHNVALNDMHMILVYAEDLKESDPNPAADVLRQWLAGTLPAAHPAEIVLLTCPRYDPWGSPYECRENVQQADGKIAALGVYSLGRDGNSRTQGNDEDDLRSWDREKSLAFYRREIRASDRASWAFWGAMLTPFTYVGLVLAIAFVRRYGARHGIVIRPRVHGLRRQPDQPATVTD